VDYIIEPKNHYFNLDDTIIHHSNLNTSSHLQHPNEHITTFFPNVNKNLSTVDLTQKGHLPKIL